VAVFAPRRGGFEKEILFDRGMLSHSIVTPFWNPDMSVTGAPSHPWADH